MKHTAKRKTKTVLGFTKSIPTKLISLPKLKMRSTITNASIMELAQSIHKHGLLQPIIVKGTDKQYHLIAGARRLAALKYLKWPEIPAYIVTANLEQAEAMKVHENMMREAINPFDEAIYLSLLAKKLNVSHKRIAAMIGKSEAYVSQRLDILRYPDQLKDALEDSTIVPSAARELFTIKDHNTRSTYIAAAIRNGITPNLAAQWRTDANALSGIEPEKTRKPSAKTPIPRPNALHLPCTNCGNPHPIAQSVMYRMCPKCDEAIKTAK